MSEKPAIREAVRSRFALSSWPLRRKVALALAVPLVLAATLGGLRVTGDLDEAASSSAGARQVTVLRPAVDYLTAASRAMVAAQSDTPASAAALSEAIEDLEAAGEEMARVRSSADLTAEQGRQVDVVLDLSRALREESETLSPGTWVAQLRQLQTGVARLVTTISGAQQYPEPRLQQLSQALAARFSLSMQQALVATERSGETGSLELFAELGAEGAAIDRLAGDFGRAEPAVLQLLIDNAVRTRTVRTGGTDLGGRGAYVEYDRLIGSLMDGIDAELAGSAAAARNRALANGAVTLAALLAAIALALLVSRLLLKPIRRVREGALDVAHVQLPEAVARIRAGDEPGPITPIDVTTQEEVGQLARAVDDLHRQAVVLAAGEAGLRTQVSQMFVTLSRRNTALVNQQLGLIDSLEKDEEDPARLDSLFRLDHLASRMRRTADSLLILADAPSSAVQEGLTVGEAMQAATAGVQDYRRVRVGTDLRMRLSPQAAGDVVHLLTELVDNALAYSAPTTSVSMDATAGQGGVVLDVTDTGLGIPDDELEALNQRLRAGGEVTPDTARRMGLFVVSRLARRHGISVELRRGQGGGTTARVLLPVDILPDLLQSRSLPVVPEPVSAASTAVPSEAAPVEAAPAASTPSVEPVRDAEPERRLEPVSLAQPEAPQQSAAAPTAGEEARTAPPVATLINSVLGLPSRVPGATLPHLPQAPEILDLPPRPTALDPIEPPESHRLREVPEIVEAAEPDPEPEPEPEPAPQPEPAPADRPVAVLDPLGGPLELVRGTADDAEGDTPIFRLMRSAWLSSGGTAQPWTSSEVEAGWEQAERVSVAAAAPALTPSGLPLRRPGASLVPGGVTKPTSPVARDPEAVRARLAAHAAGVSRGRNAVPSTDDPHPEADLT
jgi:signal transduction histidine kinase